MRKTIMIFLAFVITSLMVSAQTDYKMWETIYIKPKKGSEEALKKGMAEHNKEYHNSGPYTAHVWSVISGPHEGQWLWVMGPCTFTDLDNAPAGDEAHDDDWDEKIAVHCEKIHEVKYWKLNEKVSYDPEEYPGDKVLWTTFDIKPFKMYKFNEMLEKVVEVYNEKKYEHGFSVYTSRFDSDDGEDVVLEWQFEKWAWFDREEKFRNDFEEVHGEGSWWKFMEDYRDCVESSFDELAVYMRDLSGGE
jgi:hypothetical protein